MSWETPDCVHCSLRHDSVKSGNARTAVAIGHFLFHLTKKRPLPYRSPCMSTPNPNQPPQQPNPDPSAQGNNSPRNAGNGSGSNNQPPAGNAPAASSPLTPEQIVSLVTNAEGATGIQFSSLPAEAQRFLNSAAAAARRDGETAGRNSASAEARAQAEREALLAREREGEVDERVAAATTRANNAERERDEARREFLQLRVAMRVGSELNVQNAHLHASRLQGATEAEIEADARLFFPGIGGNVIPRDPNQPPITPAGGNQPPADASANSGGGAGTGGGNNNPPNPPQPPRNREQATQVQRSSGAYDLV